MLSDCDSDEFRHYYSHVSDNTIIRYHIHDTGYENNSYSWTTDINEIDAAQIKESLINSMKLWNDVIFYTYDENGNKIENQLVSVVEGGSNEEDHNLCIYPTNSNEGYSAYINYYSEYENEEQEILLVEDEDNFSHKHIKKYLMVVNVPHFYECGEISNENVLENKLYTGAHELGHILGLKDLDQFCSKITNNPNEGWHHGEMLMGYESAKYEDIPYQDISGVAITRGIHTDNDHVWMKRINEDETIDLICAQCNGILYNVNISKEATSYQEKELNNYKSCVHYGGENDKMLLVATNGEQDFYKCQYCRFILVINEKYTIDDKLELYLELKSNEEKTFELNITNANQYIIYFDLIDNIDITLYDENFKEIYMHDIMKNSTTLHAIKNLSIGKYYLKILNNNSTKKLFNGLILNDTDLSHLNIGENNIRSSYNSGINKYFYNNTMGYGFYRITINGKYNNDEKILLDEESFKVFDSIGRRNLINRYHNHSLYETAESKYNENTMYVYFPENTMYFINVDLENIFYSELTLTIEKIINKTEINIQNESDFPFCEEIQVFYELNDKFDYFEELTIKETGKYYIDSFYEGNQIDDIKIVLLRIRYNNDSIVLAKDCEQILNVGNKFKRTYIQLSEGDYYIGYINLQEGSIKSVTITRDITNTIDSINNGIIVDPSSADYCGTQITMVEKDLTNKSYRNTFITKGFTRHIYLDTLYAPSDSRRSYYWYSSNDNILEVTDYGTVLGKSVGSAKVFGVYKNNPSIVFVKEFTVINNLDETTIEIEFSQSYSLSSSEPCKIALNSYNSPFPKNQYYEFSFIGNNNGATIDKYGIIRNISEIGEIKIRCRYILNTKYVIIVKLTVSD